MTSLKLAVAVAVVKPTSMYMCIETFLFSATQLAQLYHGSPAEPHFRFIIESIGTVRQSRMCLVCSSWSITIMQVKSSYCKPPSFFATFEN